MWKEKPPSLKKVAWGIMSSGKARFPLKQFSEENILAKMLRIKVLLIIEY